MSEQPNPNNPAPEADPADDAPLGEGGLKALHAEREAHKQAKKQLTDLQAQIDAINAEKLSDLEKAQQAAAKAQDETAEAKREAMRYRLAAKYGISDEDAELFLTANDETGMRVQAERLTARSTEDASPRNPAPDPTQGMGKPIKGSIGDQFAALIEAKL